MIELRSRIWRKIEKLRQTLITSSSTDSVRNFASTFSRYAIAIRTWYASERVALALKTVNVVQVEKEKAHSTCFTSYTNSVTITNTLTCFLVAYKSSITKSAQTGASLITLTLLTTTSQI
jgi:hypothetical protein